MARLTVSCLLLVVLYFFSTCQAQELIAKELDEASYNNFIKSSTVTAVYFFKKDFPGLSKFLKEYERSARMLAVFNIKLAKVSCQQYAVQPYCSKKNSERSVYTFRDGTEFMDLELDTMFDVDSIIGNLLQLALLEEVPIISTESELGELQKRHQGQNDIVFAWLKSVGSYEHRIFMWVAFVYHTKGIKFALTTDKKVVSKMIDGDTNKKALMWVFRCKQATTGKCDSNQYEGKMDLASVIKYSKTLYLPLVHPLVDSTTPYDNEMKGIVYVMHSGQIEKVYVDSVAMKLALTFEGVAGVVTVDVDKVGKGVLQSRGLQPPSEIPNIAVQMLEPQKKDVSYMNDEFSEGNALAFVTKFMQDFLEETTSGSEEDTQEEMEMEYEEEVEGEDTQDDAVEESVFRLKLAEEIINTTFIPTLTDKTFPTTIQEKDLVAVLFYFKMDAESMAFLRSFADASLDVYTNSADSPLASIECWDWTDVCGKQNITQYPVLRIYRKNMEPVEYKGMWDGDTVIKTVKMYQKPVPVTLESDEKLSQFIASNLPEQTDNIYNTSVLALFNDASRKETETFNKVAEKLRAEAVFGLAVDLETSKKYLQENFKAKSPAIVVLKTADPFQPHVMYRGSLTNEQELSAFVKQARLPVFPELTPMTLPSYYSKGLPFVILFGEDFKADGVHATLGHVAASGEVPQMQFAWMDVYDDISLGTVLLKKYVNNPTFPAVVVVNHKEGKVHVYSKTDTSREAIMKWLQDVQNGNSEATVSLPKGDWKPLKPGHDFLPLVYPDGGDSAPRPVDDDKREEWLGTGHGEERDDNDNMAATHDSITDSNSDKEDEVADVLELKDKSRIYHHHHHHHHSENKQQKPQDGKSTMEHIHTEL
ncbi:thioredoxin domain-containing protein 16-like [Lingula anatina]|uniref:Thioredoxin domain-containing protein 16-like n=1 Tax=Lingula anatina TaxID=7574 RepID=A0A1S3J7L9_LINAN|nr:thioredoxin domain-containing protein 16-like [Lingula anatina]|eukprot:XP_013406303.1 thioredoxin domain-containing protein 16-like [Lingula anatina]